MPHETNRSIKVLVVDDDRVDRRAVTRAFRAGKPDTAIVEALDGEEALKLLKGDDDTPPLCKPYLVLLDLNMPRMNGHEFLERLRAEPELRDTIVFVMTTSNNETDIAQAYARNVAGYLTKQDDGESFMLKVKMIDAFIGSVEFPIN